MKRPSNASAQAPSPLYFWVLLTAVAGAVNAGAYLSCQRFVSHVTGTMTLIGVDIGSWELAFDYALVFACFVGGAVVSVVLTDIASKRLGSPWVVPVLGVITILVGVGITGHHGAFGRFGGSVESFSDFTLLSLLSFSMGLMNAAAARAAGNTRVTHLTGEATDLGVQLGMALRRMGDGRRAALLGAGGRASKLGAFALGAATMASIAPRFGYIAFLGPCAVASCVVLAAFVAERRAQRVAEPSDVLLCAPDLAVEALAGVASPSSFGGPSPSSQRAHRDVFSDSLRA